MRQLLPGLPDHARIDARVHALERQPLLHGQQNLADAEQADHRDQEIEAAQQFVGAKGHAQGAGDGVEPDGGEREAEHHRGDGLGRMALAEADEAAKGEQLHREEFGWPEPQREPRHQRRQKRDDDDRNQGADERGRERRGQGPRRRGRPLAIGWPSKVVATDHGSPGILNRIDVIAPPNSAPQ